MKKNDSAWLGLFGMREVRHVSTMLATWLQRSYRIGTLAARRAEFLRERPFWRVGRGESG